MKGQVVKTSGCKYYCCGSGDVKKSKLKEMNRKIRRDIKERIKMVIQGVEEDVEFEKVSIGYVD